MSFCVEQTKQEVGEKLDITSEIVINFDMVHCTGD